MPLILAIEPDRRQASQLTAIVRGRLRAELVLAESAERALAALGDRVPDLILTSALLSPKDEAALGEHLRALDSMAAYVQTLTIPVLAAPGKPRARSSGRGMLSALRRDRAKSSGHEGCDPGVFADQCKAYLERAEAERMIHLEEHRPPAQIEPAQIEVTAQIEVAAQIEVVPEIEAVPEIEVVPEIDASPTVDVVSTIESPLIVPPPPWIETPPQIEVAPRIEISSPPVIADKRPTLTEPPAPDAAPASLIAAVAALEAFESATVSAFESTTASASPLPTAPAEPMADESDATNAVEAAWTEEAPNAAALELDLTTLFDEAAERPSVSPHAEHDEPIVYEIDEATLDIAAVEAVQIGEPVNETDLYMPLPRMSPRWPTLESYVAELRASAMASQAGGSEPDESKEWLDIIEALRRDAQPVKLSRSQSVPVDAHRKKRRRRAGPPVQDEWGFFDPERCGFAALLAKLEEITDQEDGPAPRGA